MSQAERQQRYRKAHKEEINRKRREKDALSRTGPEQLSLFEEKSGPKPKCLCGVCKYCKRRIVKQKHRKNAKLGLVKKYITSKELDRRALERPISNTESGRSFQGPRGIGSTLGGQ